MDIGSELLSFNGTLSGRASKDLLINKVDRNDDVSSCNTSDCSFEMDPEDDLNGLRLCSIDELFASPPVVQKNSEDFLVAKKSDSAIAKTESLVSVSSLNEQLLTNHDDNTHQSSLCWSCKKNKPKYKCPQCLKRTCSLACVKLHKQKLNCQGERNKTEFVSKENFTESHFLSDYRFLEEINRCVSKRNHFPRPYFKSKRMKLLANKAYAMKIRLEILPSSFKRRKENSTFYCFKNRQFLWHVEWVFVDCCVTINDRRVPDDKSLLDCVKKFIVPSTNNDHFDSRLNEYHMCKDINFYMKKECTKANEILYYKLNADEGLRRNLEGKTIIEYPRVYVVMPKQARIYDLSLCID